MEYVFQALVVACHLSSPTNCQGQEAYDPWFAEQAKPRVLVECMMQIEALEKKLRPMGMMVTEAVCKIQEK
jgi:hypothetical protein